MTPFYKHLSGIPGLGVASNVDEVGVLATAAVGAAFVGHGLIQLGIRRRGAHDGPAGTPEVPAKKQEERPATETAKKEGP